MDLTDLNNWPDGAEACINGYFTKWVGEKEFTFGNKKWVEGSHSLSIDFYKSHDCKITMRPQESDKWKEGEERMKVIPQNGNDGWHYEELDKSVDSTLSERGSRYGEFIDVSDTTQAIKDIMKGGKNSGGLSSYQIEALDMIASKIARIVNGDPDYIDNWHDIAGYARLVEIELEK